MRLLEKIEELTLYTLAQQQKLEAQQQQIASLEGGLGALEEAAGADGTPSPPSSSGLFSTWLLVGGLLLAGLVLGQLGTMVLRRKRA